MDEDQLKNNLQDMEKPTPPLPAQRNALKFALVNARRSSWLGAVLIAFPFFIVSLFFIQNLFGLGQRLTAWIAESTSFLPTSGRALFFFLFLTGCPFLGIILNMLSITCIYYDKVRREVNISIKLRWWNILVVILGTAVASFYALHLLADSVLGNR